MRHGQNKALRRQVTKSGDRALRSCSE